MSHRFLGDHSIGARRRSLHEVATREHDRNVSNCSRRTAPPVPWRRAESAARPRWGVRTSTPWLSRGTARIGPLAIGACPWRRACEAERSGYPRVEDLDEIGLGCDGAAAETVVPKLILVRLKTRYAYVTAGSLVNLCATGGAKAVIETPRARAAHPTPVAAHTISGSLRTDGEPHPWTRPQSTDPRVLVA